MGERSDGTWAARQIAVSAPRQNGKSEIIVARALAGVLLFNEQTIIVSAHQQDTAREVFGRIVDLIDANPSLARRVAPNGLMRALNRESIRFSSGQTIRFKARSTGGGRGFSCDCLLLDEAQILGASAWSAILPTMSARPNPQAWLLGTPPTENDDVEVFGRLRAAGVDGSNRHVAYIEWSADPDDDLDDPAVWAAANPAYGMRISHDAIAAERASMSDDQFRCERLGVWPDHLRHKPIVKPDAWRNLASDGPDRAAAPAAFGVDMSHRKDISVMAAWHTDRGLHIEEVLSGRDVDEAVRWIARVAGRVPVLIDSYSPAVQMVPNLTAARVKVKRTSAREMTAGAGIVESRLAAGTLTHADQAPLTLAVMAAVKRPIGDAGGFGWDRKDASKQIHPLVAGTLAMVGASAVDSDDASGPDAFFL